MEGLLVTEVMFENLCGNSPSKQKVLMKLRGKKILRYALLKMYAEFKNRPASQLMNAHAAPKVIGAVSFNPV